MFTHHHFLLLLLLPFLGCVVSKKWVMVNLANGGTSLPFQVNPLTDGHLEESLPEALPQQAPTTSQLDAVEIVEGHEETNESGGKNDNMVDGNNYTEEQESGMIQVTGDEVVNVTLPNPTTTTTTTTKTSTTTTTTMATTTSTRTTKIAPTTTEQPHNTQPQNTSETPPHPCHLSCLESLNSIHFTPNNTLTLRAGSSLTLKCQIPLVPELIVEDMLWLFHPAGTPEGRCSLTTHPYLPSCPGSPSLLETDCRNDTLMMQILTLSNLGTNYTGEYMCQVQVTCCPGHQEHVMSQQREAQVSVKVWWADYTLELAGTGVVAAVLLLTLFGVSAYGWRQANNNQYVSVVEVEVPPILHLPLIDDQDTDSFTSSILDEVM